MIEKNEIIIRDDGAMTYRTITEQQCTVTDNFINSLMATVAVTHRNFGDASQIVPPEYAHYFGKYGILVKPDSVGMVVRVRQLLFRTPVTMLDGGYCTPQFCCVSGSTFVEFEWVVPDHIKVFYATQAQLSAGFTNLANSYLFATDALGLYRLPTSNVYDDCRVCTGEYNSRGRAFTESLSAGLQQLIKGPWNADLFAVDTRGPLAARLFRFKPKQEGEGFEQQPMDDTVPWTSLCGPKVSTPLLQEYKAATPNL